MEIDITDFFANAEHAEFSGSVAERGANAGPETWHNAMDAAKSTVFLTTAEQLDEFRNYMREFGAWDDSEIKGWSEQECNALFIQLVSGDVRENEDLCMNVDGEVDWTLHDELAHRGTISSCIYQGDDGKIYYYVGT